MWLVCVALYWVYNYLVGKRGWWRDITRTDVAQYRANYIQLLVPVTCNMGNKGNQYETTMTTYLCRKIIIQRVR